MRYLVASNGDRMAERLYEEMALAGTQVLRLAAPAPGKLHAIVRFRPDVILVRQSTWAEPSPFMRFMLDLAQFAARPVIALLTAEEYEAEGKPERAQAVVLAPYDIEQVVAQAHGALAGAPPHDDLDAPFQRGDVVIDPAGRRVQVSGEPVELTFPEFELLVRLCRAEGRVLRRDELVYALGGSSSPARLRAIDIHILRLRHKLQGARRLKIETVRKVGYRCAELSNAAPE